MTWHYQVTIDKFQDSDIDRYSIREVYDDGKLWSMEPEELVAESREELIEILELMLADAKKYPAIQVEYLGGLGVLVAR